MEKLKKLQNDKKNSKVKKAKANPEFATPNATAKEEDRKEHYKKSVNKFYKEEEKKN